MAGRGVDIKLGGSPEGMAAVRAPQARPLARRRELRGGAEGDDRAAQGRSCEAEAEEVRQLGGLFICGTERHESRRIDNQLRGRSGRQGDPGESRFFLSAEDDLIRLFAGDRIYKILDRLGPGQRGGRGGGARGEDAHPDDRERPEEGRGAELPDPQAGARVRRRDERAAARGLQVPPRDPRGQGHVRRRPRGRGRGRQPHGRRLHARRRDRGLGPRRAPDPGPAALALDRRRLGAEAGADRPRGPARAAARRRARLLRPPRAGVRRRDHAPARAGDPAADHRQPLARAPLRDGLPARGHPPPRLRPDRPAGRLQERGLLDVRGAHALDLGGVRAADLPRRGRGRAAGAGAVRARRAAAAGSTTPAGPPSSPRRSARPPSRRRRGRTWPPSRRSRARPATAAAIPEQETVVKDEKDKIGRNDPCWCGSGKKYKKCHGA